MHSVSGSSSDDVWAVGIQVDVEGPRDTIRSLIEHWDGSGWSVVPTPDSGGVYDALSSVVAVSSDDAWAVGFRVDADGTNHTLILHWDGIEWTAVEGADAGPANLHGVAATASDVWAVGVALKEGTSETLVRHFDGTSWEVVPSGNLQIHNRLFAVDVIGDSVWAVGHSGDQFEQRFRTLAVGCAPH